MIRRLTAFVVAFALPIVTASAAKAQDASGDWAHAISQAREGDVVHVTDTAGRAFKWKLADVPLNELIQRAGLFQDGVTTVAIERTDKLWNGALIGLVAAGAPWLAVCATNDWCYYNEYGAENLLRVTAITTAAIGAGIGALVDLSIRRRMTMFPNASTSSLSLAPEISPGRTAVRVSMTF